MGKKEGVGNISYSLPSPRQEGTSRTSFSMEFLRFVTSEDRRRQVRSIPKCWVLPASPVVLLSRGASIDSLIHWSPVRENASLSQPLGYDPSLTGVISARINRPETPHFGLVLLLLEVAAGRKWGEAGGGEVWAALVQFPSLEKAVPPEMVGHRFRLRWWQGREWYCQLPLIKLFFSLRLELWDHEWDCWLTGLCLQMQSP